MSSPRAATSVADQHLQLAVLERGERLEACGLRLVAVDRRGDEAVLLELAGEARRAVLGAHEAQHLPVVARLDEVHEQRALVLLRDLVGALVDRLGGGVAARDLDQLRLVEELVGELLDLAGERGGEQQVLALRGRGQERHDALDVRDEAHVEHAVGFVEDEDLDLSQVDALLLDVVEQAPRRGDQDLDAAADDRQLLLDVDAAVDDRRAQVGVLAVLADRFLDLDRELACRREDQRAHRVPGGRGARVRVGRQPVQDRQAESGGLAGAGLGAAHDVLARKDDGDRLLLDRGGGGVAGLGHGPENLRPQAELRKARGTAHHDIS